MIKRLIFGVMAIAFLGAGATVAVFAAAFGLYALLEPSLGKAGAAGTLVGAVALLMLLASLILYLVARPPRAPKSRTPQGPVETVMSAVKEKPLVSIAAVAAAAVAAFRNPAAVMALVGAFFGAESNQPRR